MTAAVTTTTKMAIIVETTTATTTMMAMTTTTMTKAQVTRICPKPVGDTKLNHTYKTPWHSGRDTM